MNIHGRKIILRAPEKHDCSMIREMFNDPEIENLVIGWSFPLSEYSQEQWFSSHYNDTNNFRFVIEIPGGEALGIATLTNIDWKNRNAAHGIKLLSRENRGKGIGTDTVMAIMRYAFDELNLHRLDGSWFATNTPSINLYKKCGWREEGIRRSCVFKRGEYRDIVTVGILASEYRELAEKTHYWD
ncbi:MAG: GNAT family N-acetyltransferase [Synergistaceae bacterium]|nr:GNAT family N-acetyltransferase [Synergistaceae bacterium]